jgi:hypothetical protein
MSGSQANRKNPLPAALEAAVLRAAMLGTAVLGTAVLGVLLAMPARGASRIDLDQDWLFRADLDQIGEASGWNSSIPSDTESVNLPHTWNIGRLHDYLGVAWYFRRFEPPLAPAAHTELHFGATFYSARVWLNGQELGRHEGGFTAYSFDIKPRRNAMNVLAVRIDNRPGVATIPGFAERGAPQARYDWWTYGGMVRDVWLTTTGPAWVGRQEIRASRAADRSVKREPSHWLPAPPTFPYRSSLTTRSCGASINRTSIAWSSSSRTGTTGSWTRTATHSASEA